jgi:tRNA(Ile)-lysidine synthase
VRSPPPEAFTRLAAALDALIAPGLPLGVAVSGGADSLALLLLAAAARPGLIEAATVDHGLRADAAGEARMVAATCERIGIPHRILAVTALDPAGNLQARAREARYLGLAHWAEERGLTAVATAHHADDQAETLLMRLARGSGIGGLCGVQRSRPLSAAVMLVRPLLDWRRDDLHAIVRAAGLAPVDDPSNREERFDRTRARTLLATTDWLDPVRLAAAAANVADAEQALAWAADGLLEQRCRPDGPALLLDPAGLPRELKRRLLLAAMRKLGCAEPSGPGLMAALDGLERGVAGTLAGLKLEPSGRLWRLAPAPPRSTRPAAPSI